MAMGLLAAVVVLSSIGLAAAQSGGALPLVSQTWTRFELQLLPLRPLRFSFSAASVPGVEALKLPTFEADATWLEQGPLSIHTFSRVAPALELDCALACQPLLEQSLGVEQQLALGGFGPSVPATWLSLGAARTQVMPAAPGQAARPRSGTLLRAGFNGLLAF